jgi:hypothetical protein
LISSDYDNLLTNEKRKFLLLPKTRRCQSLILGTIFVRLGRIICKYVRTTMISYCTTHRNFNSSITGKKYKISTKEKLTMEEIEMKVLMKI